MSSLLYFMAIRKAFRIATGPISGYQASQEVRRLQSSHPDTSDYPRYLQVQIQQTRGKARKDASERLVPYVALAHQHCTDLSPDFPLLCIGSRNEVELNAFEERKFQRITAIDRYDFKNREGLLSHFAPHVNRVIVKDVRPDEMVLRFTLKKQANVSHAGQIE
jgi:hypothetical protein